MWSASLVNLKQGVLKKREEVPKASQRDQTVRAQGQVDKFGSIGGGVACVVAGSFASFKISGS